MGIWVRTVKLRVTVSHVFAMVGTCSAVGQAQFRLRRVQQLHEDEDKYAERGSCQVAHALGQRHGGREWLSAISSRLNP